MLATTPSGLSLRDMPRDASSSLPIASSVPLPTRLIKTPVLNDEYLGVPVKIPLPADFSSFCDSRSTSEGCSTPPTPPSAYPMKLNPPPGLQLPADGAVQRVQLQCLPCLRHEQVSQVLTDHHEQVSQVSQEFQQPFQPAADFMSVSNAPGAMRPLLLWCGEKPADQPCANALGCESIRFQSPVEFARWLFLQKRGNITPGAMLVVGRREAKPCLMAIAAASTGCVAKLRPDARRAKLQPLSGIPEGEEASAKVTVAVGTVVIKLQNVEQQFRVQALKSMKHQVPNLDIQSACDNDTLSHMLLSSAQMKGTSEEAIMWTSLSCALAVLD